jgi:hypothetical protein
METPTNKTSLADVGDDMWKFIPTCPLADIGDDMWKSIPTYPLADVGSVLNDRIWIGYNAYPN